MSVETSVIVITDFTRYH